MLFAQTIGHVIRDAQGIEKSAFLKHKSDLPAKAEQFFFGHAAQIVAEHAHGSRIRLQKPRSQLQGERLSRSTFPDQNFCLARRNGKGKAVSTSPLSKPIRTFSKERTGSLGESEFIVE